MCQLSLFQHDRTLEPWLVGDFVVPAPGLPAGSITEISSRGICILWANGHSSRYSLQEMCLYGYVLQGVENVH